MNMIKKRQVNTFNYSVLNEVNIGSVTKVL